MVFNEAESVHCKRMLIHRTIIPLICEINGSEKKNSYKNKHNTSIFIIG
jgi:hypothetical protein